MDNFQPPIAAGLFHWRGPSDYTAGSKFRLRVPSSRGTPMSHSPPDLPRFPSDSADSFGQGRRVPGPLPRWQLILVNNENADLMVVVHAIMDLTRFCRAEATHKHVAGAPLRQIAAAAHSPRACRTVCGAIRPQRAGRDRGTGGIWVSAWAVGACGPARLPTFAKHWISRIFPVLLPVGLTYGETTVIRAFGKKGVRHRCRNGPKGASHNGA